MAGLTTKQEQVLKIQLDYFYNGTSMKEATSKANADWQTQNGKRLKKMTTDEAAAQEKILRTRINATRKANKILVADTASSYQKMASSAKAYGVQAVAAVKSIGTAAKTSAMSVLSSTGGMLKTFGKRIVTLGGYMAAMQAIQALTQAIGFAIKSFIEMESAFVDMAAKLGYTNTELNRTTEVIMEVAVATQYTTVEITKAATALGKLGFTASEVRDILPGVAQTAAATGEALEKVATTIGAVMNAFGFDSDRAGSVGDRLTNAFRTSALDLTKFGTAFNYVGAAAASTGTSLDEVVSAMSVLADRGVTASKMGTGLRKVFVRLQEEGMSLGDVIKQMNDRSITFSDSVALVGQIGATQLKILSDNYGEFVSNIDDANDTFGASMIAAARQQETVANTWARIKNQFANVFAPNFSEDEGGWTIQNRSGWKKFLDSWEKANAEVSDIFSKQGKKTQEIYDKAAIAFVGQEAFRDALEREVDKGSDLSEWLRQELIERGFATEANDINQEYIDAILRGVADFDVQVAAEQLVQEQEKQMREILKRAAKIREDEGPLAANEYLEYEASAYDAAGTDGGTYGYGLRSMLGLPNEDGEYIRSKKTSEDPTKHIDAQLELLKSTRKMHGAFDEALSTEKDSWYRRQAEIDKITSDLCNNSPKWFLDLHSDYLGCKEKTGRRTSKREAIPFDEGSENKFLQAKAELEFEYGLTEDPIEKDKINTKLLDLEQAYYATKLMIVEDYIIKQEALLENANLSTADRADYEKNKTSGEKSATSILKKSLDTMEKRLTEEHKVVQKAWKVTQADAGKHNAKMKVLDSQYDLAQTPELKAQKLEEKRRAIADYYDKQLQDQKAYLKKAKQNVADAVGTGADVSDSQAFIDGFDVLQDTTKSYRGAAFGNVDKDGDKDVKTQEEIDADNKAKAIKNAQAAVEIAAAVADIYKDIAQDRLNILQEQYQREVELLEQKFADEQSVRDSALASGIISQEDAIRAEEDAERRKNEKMNAMAEKLFQEKKKAAIEALIIDGIVGAAMATVQMLSQGMPWAAPVMAGLALAASGVAVAAEKRKKYVPQVFAEGGIVNGPSHSQGGVPFSVSGRGGYEMEGGEYIVNKQAVKNNFDLLESINGKVNTRPTYFAAGGYVPTPSNTPESDMSLAIIEALNQPVRAYVTDQDLSTAQSERTALATKTSY